MRTHSEEVGDAGKSQIEVIHGFANYFKYAEEWPKELSKEGGLRWKTTGSNGRTLGLVRAVGVPEGDLTSCTTGLDALGGENRWQVGVLATIVLAWDQALFNAYGEEISNEGRLG